MSNEEQPKNPADRPGEDAAADDAAPRAARDPSAEDTLEALRSLEALLSTRHGLPPDPDPPGSEPSGATAPTAADPRTAARHAGAIEGDGQYTIPLLNEVVLPGPDIDVRDPPPVLSPTAQRLFDRLASEIDVIVQTGVDDALKAAARDIRRQVKQHVAIVLPEILDELSHDDDGPAF